MLFLPPPPAMQYYLESKSLCVGNKKTEQNLSQVSREIRKD